MSADPKPKTTTLLDEGSYEVQTQILKHDRLLEVFSSSVRMEAALRSLGRESGYDLEVARLLPQVVSLKDRSFRDAEKAQLVIYRTQYQLNFPF